MLPVNMQMDGWMDGWMDVSMYQCVYQENVPLLSDWKDDDVMEHKYDEQDDVSTQCIYRERKRERERER